MKGERLVGIASTAVRLVVGGLWARQWGMSYQAGSNAAGTDIMELVSELIKE